MNVSEPKPTPPKETFAEHLQNEQALAFQKGETEYLTDYVGKHIWEAVDNQRQDFTLEFCKELIKRGVSVKNLKLDPKTTMSLLRVFMEARHMEGMKYLIQNGSDIGQQNDHGFTPIMIAVIRGLRRPKDIEFLKCLLEAAGFSRQTRNNDKLFGLKLNSLGCCISPNRSTGAYGWLNGSLNTGNNPLNIKNKYGKTALMIAQGQGNPEVVQLLLDAGATV